MVKKPENQLEASSKTLQEQRADSTDTSGSRTGRMEDKVEEIFLEDRNVKEKQKNWATSP